MNCDSKPSQASGHVTQRLQIEACTFLPRSGTKLVRLPPRRLGRIVVNSGSDVSTTTLLWYEALSSTRGLQCIQAFSKLDSSSFLAVPHCNVGRECVLQCTTCSPGAQQKPEASEMIDVRGRPTKRLLHCHVDCGLGHDQPADDSTLGDKLARY